MQSNPKSRNPGKRAVSAKARRRLGSYELHSQIGEGGMGRVFAGKHVFLDQRVAIKVIKPGLPGTDEFIERFRKEAQALARVYHPNVVQVLDIVQAGGQTFIAMDFAPGMDLAHWLKRDGRLKPNELLYVAQQVIAGVAAAHDAGILHRDIKPDNIIVDHHGSVKITDFGLADDARLSESGTSRQLFATPAYAAPEVLSGDPATARSDVFSLGATLYHIATGELPFGKGPTADVLERQRKGAAPLQELAPELPVDFTRAVMDSLSLDPSERPAVAGDVISLAFPSAGIRRAELRRRVGLVAFMLLLLALVVALAVLIARELDDGVAPRTAAKSGFVVSASCLPLLVGARLASPGPMLGTKTDEGQFEASTHGG